MPTPSTGRLFAQGWFDRYRRSAAGETVMRIVSVDPAETGYGDEAGIVAAAATPDGRVLWTDDWSGKMQSDRWARRAVLLALKANAQEISFEAYTTEQTYTRVIRHAWEDVRAQANLLRKYNRDVHAAVVLEAAEKVSDPVVELSGVGGKANGDFDKIEVQQSDGTFKQAFGNAISAPVMRDALLWFVPVPGGALAGKALGKAIEKTPILNKGVAKLAEKLPTPKPTLGTGSPVLPKHSPLDPDPLPNGPIPGVHPPAGTGGKTPPLDSTWPGTGKIEPKPGAPKFEPLPSHRWPNDPNEFPYPPLNGTGNPYPRVIDLRSGEPIPHPPRDLPTVPPELRIKRGTFRKKFSDEWLARGYPFPPPGNPLDNPFKGWEIHHIIPIKNGGTNDFNNLIPLPKEIHDLFTDWWTFF